MIPLARRLLILTLGLSCCPALAQSYEVSPELWDRPRSAGAVTGEGNVKRAVTALLAQPEARLVIRHGASQESVLQAEELKSWLGALAIDTRRVALRSDLGAGTAMRLELQP